MNYYLLLVINGINYYITLSIKAGAALNIFEHYNALHALLNNYELLCNSINNLLINYIINKMQLIPLIANIIY